MISDRLHLFRQIFPLPCTSWTTISNVFFETASSPVYPIFFLLTKLKCIYKTVNTVLLRKIKSLLIENCVHCMFYSFRWSQRSKLRFIKGTHAVCVGSLKFFISSGLDEECCYNQWANPAILKLRKI